MTIGSRREALEWERDQLLAESRADLDRAMNGTQEELDDFLWRHMAGGPPDPKAERLVALNAIETDEERRERAELQARFDRMTSAELTEWVAQRQGRTHHLASADQPSP